MKKPKAPKPSAQEVAMDIRQKQALDEEIGEQEQRFKALARGKLGSASLLGGAPRSRTEAAMGGRASKGAAAGAGRSMLGGLAGAARRGAAGAAQAGLMTSTMGR
tara:strand:- start:2 stop:316 length:315 start_codon:yes stop_codon:yes gene_type:complete